MRRPRAKIPAKLRRYLDHIVRQYHRANRVAYDPVNFVRRYADPADREVAAVVASTLAFGHLRGILRSVAAVLSRLDPHPSLAVAPRPGRTAWLRTQLDGIQHRWANPQSLVALLEAVGDLQARDGRLEHTFRAAREGTTDVWQALDRFVHRLYETSSSPHLRRLLPDPCRGSACKRLWLFLRWMTRCDEVDPGGWNALHPAELYIPLDVHTFRAARRFGWTQRRTPDRVAAVEVTRVLRRLCPSDPVRYDFALAHAGAANRGGRHALNSGHAMPRASAIDAARR